MANCLILLAQGHWNRHRKAIPAPAESAGGKPRVHHCSICGSEFASGQALGGHMRRHRSAIAGETQEAKKEQRRSFLCVDLNLPPSDHEGFPFAGDHPPPVLAVAAIVGCHH
ncbi:unnamed protein product [Spirodela intermedia]|uniref:C2H2-type domain-containing protein n=1 Tax=Spirodela intermedia TaxID=51605 RepID=A0A7I8IXR3_SPIIN|nr:unnamed protein product [Spirodela intermedia]CAA6662589.1 unnamed protein product [Spirodela intermedia]